MASASDPAEPLMRGADEHQDQDDNEDAIRDNNDIELNELEQHSSPTSFVWILTLVAGVSGLLFGYDTGVISSTLVSIHSDLSGRPLTTLDKSLITSCTAFFALVASPLTGFVLADVKGRKPAILLASCLFVIGAVWQALTTTVVGMIAARSVIGLAVGSASFLVPLYIAELSPSAWRGRLVTIASLFITGGQVVAYVVGWLFSQQVGGWRWMVGLGAAPAAVQLILLCWMPETPRFLVKAERRPEAAAVLSKVYGMRDEETERIVNGILRAIERELQAEKAARRGKQAVGSKHQHPIVDLVKVGGNRRALTIACMLQAAQQLVGFNCLMYFSATIFALVGFTSPTLTSLSIAITNFVFTLVAFFAIDRIGRRRILLGSIPFMTIGLLFSALAFVYLDVQFAKPEPVAMDANSSTNASSPPPRSSTSAHWAPPLLLASFVLYVAAYALGLGNVPWQQSELFPLRVRSIGASISTATNWLSNTLVGLTFLPMLELLSPQVTFLVYAGVCCAAWVGVWWCYPETAGLGLEEVGALLNRGWGVQESTEAWQMRRRVVHRGVNDPAADAGGL